MPERIWEDMKSYVGFTAEDEANLRALAEPLAPRLPEVVHRFYAEIENHTEARRVLDDDAQVTRLRKTLLDWLETLFCGTYDIAYIERRAAIGQAHVTIDLPQHYMLTAMEIVWQEMERIVSNCDMPDKRPRLRSVHKLLTLELGLMLQSYKAASDDRLLELERTAIQERLSRAEHLAQIGQLAASLAHEIKNPLAGISGAIQVLRGSMPKNNPHRPILEEILRQIDRLDGTVKDLLVYARPQPPQFEPCHLQAVIERVVNLLDQEQELQGRRFVYADCSRLPALDADEHQLEQLLINLLLNAAHASPLGESVRLRVALDGPNVKLTVEDRGVGMDEQVRDKVFEPFFTTKARGSGLGLSICQRIVEAHGGSITIRSQPGDGTAVEVCLPLAKTPRGSGED